jgi:hypothetical protein
LFGDASVSAFCEQRLLLILVLDSPRLARLTGLEKTPLLLALHGQNDWHVPISFPSNAQLTAPDVKHMNFPGLDLSSKRPLHAQPERRVTNEVSEEGAVMHY